METFRPRVCGRCDCTQITAQTTTTTPAICGAERAWSSTGQAMIAASTGSSVATTAARGAGMWRTAVTIRMNGTSVPTTVTPSTPSARLPASANASNGKVHGGRTTSQNRVAKPKP